MDLVGSPTAMNTCMVHNNSSDEQYECIMNIVQVLSHEYQRQLDSSAT